MPRTITIDGVSLHELRVTKNAAGDLIVNAVFNLLSGTRVVTTVNTNATSILNTTEQGTVGAVFSAIEGALARDQTS